MISIIVIGCIKNIRLEILFVSISMLGNNENMNENNNNKLIHSLKYIYFFKEHCLRVCFL